MKRGRSVYVVSTPEDYEVFAASYSALYELENVATLPRLDPRKRVFKPVFHAPLSSAWDPTVITAIGMRK